PEPWRAAYVQPSRRPTDGRYGENPNRVQQYYQLQVILKPAPADSQELYLASLAAIGIDAALHDVRFVEDDWESPTLSGWRCMSRASRASSISTTTAPPAPAALPTAKCSSVPSGNSRPIISNSPT